MDEAQTFDVAVVGATGVVGEVLIPLLESRDFPLGRLYPLASERSLGNKVLLRGNYLSVDDVATFDFSQAALVFFVCDADTAGRYAPLAAEAGAVVIDTSPAFRADDDVPLVIPEVNPSHIGRFGERRIIASPGAATIPLLMILKPLLDAVGVARVDVTSCQAASGGGRAAVQALASQSAGLLNLRGVEVMPGEQQIAFNLAPQIGELLDNGYTRAEMEMVWESQKVLDDSAIVINPTAVRVPVFFGHSAVLHIETTQPLEAAQARRLLTAAPGVRIMEGPQPADVPSAVGAAAGEDAVFVGRVRQAIGQPRGVDLWLVSDNVRRGAALNAVQIAEILVKEYL